MTAAQRSRLKLDGRRSLLGWIAAGIIIPPATVAWAVVHLHLLQAISACVGGPVTGIICIVHGVNRIRDARKDVRSGYLLRYRGPVRAYCTILYDDDGNENGKSYQLDAGDVTLHLPYHDGPRLCELGISEAVVEYSEHMHELLRLTTASGSDVYVAGDPGTVTFWSQAPGSSAANWYPDPSGRHELRYWDGRQWCDSVSDSGQRGSDPLPEPTGDRQP